MENIYKSGALPGKSNKTMTYAKIFNKTFRQIPPF